MTRQEQVLEVVTRMHPQRQGSALIAAELGISTDAAYQFAKKLVKAGTLVYEDGEFGLAQAPVSAKQGRAERTEAEKALAVAGKSLHLGRSRKDGSLYLTVAGRYHIVGKGFQSPAEAKTWAEAMGAEVVSGRAL